MDGEEGLGDKRDGSGMERNVRDCEDDARNVRDDTKKERNEQDICHKTVLRLSGVLKPLCLLWSSTSALV